MKYNSPGEKIRAILTVAFCMFLCAQLSVGIYGIVKTNKKDIQAVDASPSASSETRLRIVGRSPFGIFSPKFDCQNFLNSLDRVKAINIATLYNTFGNDFDCIKTVLQDPRLKALEIHLINEPCVRNGRCGPYEFLSGISPRELERLLLTRNARFKDKFQKYVERLQDLLQGYMSPDTECQISFGLESNIKDMRAIRISLDWVKESFPMCKTVWNPIAVESESRFKQSGADYYEQHGDGPQVQSPCIVNNDGTIIPFDKMQDFIDSYATTCRSIYLWTLQDNCWGDGYDPSSFIDPRRRDCAPLSSNSQAARQVVLSERKRIPVVPGEWTESENKSLVGCKTFLPSRDGSKSGFLWKQSDAHPGIVVLLPGQRKKGAPFEGDVTQVNLFHKGKKIMTLNRRSMEIFIEDGSRNRPLLRTPNIEKRKISSVPFHVVLKDESGKICRRIDNPKTRND